MRSRLQRHSLELAYTFCGVVLIGAIISGLITTDTRWMNWHFSRLGEGGMLSAAIFNVSLLISSLVMFALGMALSDNISYIAKTKGTDLAKAKKVISRSFYIISGCLVGLSFFPFDRFPVVHNIFGYSMFFVFLTLCVITPKILPFFSKRFSVYGKLAILLAIICYFLFLVIGSISLLLVETIMFLFLYGWLLLFINGILREASKTKKN